VEQYFLGNTSVRQRAYDYALALVIIAVAVAGRYALDWILPGHLAYITFFPAVLVTA
jgi:hypothetical protein